MGRLAIVLLAWGLANHAPARLSGGYETASADAVLVTAADSTFAGLVARLSEPGGFFDSDNLISNEATYLHVLGAMRRLGVSGGAYIGVGPDQNFSYIAQVRPAVAYLIDIRRDNLLQHLWFKALFANARNRLEYLCLLFAREPPEDVTGWTGEDIDEIVEYLDVMPPDAAVFEDVHRRVRTTIASFGVPLDSTDYATIRRFHETFQRAGLDLRFTSRGRATRSYYPTYRMLLLETDLEGNRASYLADEERFRVVRQLEADNRVIPVVGDLAGDHALAAIGREVERRGLVVSAFYTSNVEYYLMLDRSFDRFAATVSSALPWNDTSVIIRSYFGRGWPHPQNIRGYYATQLVERMETFVEQQAAGGYASYADLVSVNILENR